MVDRRAIRAFVDDLVRQFRPSKVILFGSYAYGTPGEDSDVDLMVVVSCRGSRARMASKIRMACPRDFPMDLLVRSPAEMRRRMKGGDAFLGKIASRGIVLHESHDARVD